MKKAQQSASEIIQASWFAQEHGSGFFAAALTDGAKLIEEQAARIAELQAELEREKKETGRLDGAWHALHERMVKDNEGHARYFEKSQARIHELFDAEAASQARLSEAVKVLERIAANYEDGATFSGTQCADIANQFIATLGENKNET